MGSSSGGRSSERREKDGRRDEGFGSQAAMWFSYYHLEWLVCSCGSCSGVSSCSMGSSSGGSSSERRREKGERRDEV